MIKAILFIAAAVLIVLVLLLSLVATLDVTGEWNGKS